MALSKHAVDEIRELPARFPEVRSAVMPALDIAQEELGGHLTPQAMSEVAELLKLDPGYIEGVATFYTLFHLEPTGEHHFYLCTNLSCMLRGAAEIADHIKQRTGVEDFGEVSADGLFSVEEVECLGACEYAPMMRYQHAFHYDLTKEKVDMVIDAARGSAPTLPSPATGDAPSAPGSAPTLPSPGTGDAPSAPRVGPHPTLPRDGGGGVMRGSHGPGRHHLLTGLFGTPGLHRLDVYRGCGGYSALRKALTAMSPEEVHAEVKTSGLRGRGGAGFPTGTKWGFVPKDVPGPRYVVVNADESEPGTSKDRYLMENSPHLALEGSCIAAYAVGAHQAWIYIRGEYDRPRRMLMEAIGELHAAGILGPRPFGVDYPLDIQLYRGHGAYICGEETALLESLEGKRAQPRSRPPFPAVKGAWGRPTLLNNVETLSALPWIVANGGDQYARFGTERSRGTRLLSVSGNVQNPGVYEVELGVSFRHVIMELAGGPPPGRRVKVFWPGGSSAPVLPESMLDTSTDLDELARAGSMAGSGGVIVMDDAHCVVEAAHRLLRFYAHESCGKCTPCRTGGNWAVRTYERILAGEGGPADLAILDRIQESLQNGRCLCALGDSAGFVIMSTMQHFRDEYEEHALRNECSARKVLANA